MPACFIAYALTRVRLCQVVESVLDINDSQDLQRIRIEIVLNTITARVTRLIHRQEADDQMYAMAMLMRWWAHC